MIEVRNITKSFDGKTILHDVSAKFYSGKTNLIIGQSGSGELSETQTRSMAFLRFRT